MFWVLGLRPLGLRASGALGLGLRPLEFSGFRVFWVLGLRPLWVKGFGFFGF